MTKRIKIRIAKSNDPRNSKDVWYIESGSGENYRCYGVALNGPAAKRFAAQVRVALATGTI